MNLPCEFSVTNATFVNLLLYELSNVNVLEPRFHCCTLAFGLPTPIPQQRSIQLHKKREELYTAHLKRGIAKHHTDK